MCWFSCIDVLSMVTLFHGKKEDTSDIYSHCPTTDFCATFLYNRRCLTSEKTISRDKNKVAATPTEQGNICFEYYIKNQQQCC